MREEFLYYIWENRLTDKDLKTTEGEAVEVVATGYRNTDSGPDFLEAKIQIGDKLWAGHVEIHVKTSDWNLHGHQSDKAFKNVILHVVYENDAKVNDIPILELKGHFDESLFVQYQKLIASRTWIPCEKSISQVPVFTRLSWLDRMAVERLESKSEAVTKILKSNQFDWEDALYKLLMRYFGLKVNNEAFEYLANILPFKTLLKHADNLLQVEAMLMGCAGFLEDDFTEEYPLLLKREYSVMKAKFNLLTMPAERWKFMRMRPSNFPTIRLAQMAQLIHKNGPLFSKIKAAKDSAEAKASFDVAASGYWETHWRFEKREGLPRCERLPRCDSPTRSQPKHLGNATADLLLINAVVPLLFCYGKLHKDESVCEMAMQFLEDTEAEDNAIIRHFVACGITAENAMQTQALLHLYSYFCKRKRCLECRIGNVLLHKTNQL
ncbi:MAG: DUF2851 family protein [Bacteroidales bacterium]|nr:DUF2851 family protein [Bacteroidales bacterium]